MFEVEGFEADDLIATATKELTVGSTIITRFPILIASADKDLLALVSNNVSVHSTLNGDILGPAEVIEKLGVSPCQVVDYLTLVGDVSDNIRGAKGIGPKTAVAMLTLFGNIDDIFLAMDSGEAGLTPSQFASLLELRPRLESVRALVTMRTDVPMDVSQVFQPRVPKSAETFMEMAAEEMAEVEPIDDRSTYRESLGLTQETDTKAAPSPAGALPGMTAEEVNARLREHERKFGPAKTTAIVPVVASEPAPAEWERCLEPRSMADARNLSKWLHESHMFDGYHTPQGVMSTVLLGRELGIPSMASLRSVHIIEGKHSLSADLMVALVLKSGLAEYFQMSSSNDSMCTFETKRKGAPTSTILSYTIEQAKQAGLLAPTRSGKPSNWQKIPKQMLRARAKSELARLEYPDLLAGLYTPEELHEAKD